MTTAEQNSSQFWVRINTAASGFLSCFDLILPLAVITFIHFILWNRPWTKGFMSSHFSLWGWHCYHLLSVPFSRLENCSKEKSGNLLHISQLIIVELGFKGKNGKLLIQTDSTVPRVTWPNNEPKSQLCTTCFLHYHGGTTSFQSPITGMKS